MLRSAIAILAGFAVVVALSIAGDAASRALFPAAFGPMGRVDATATLLALLGYVAVFLVVGGLVAARIAAGRPVLHALIVGVLFLSGHLIGTVILWGTAPAWYHLTSIALVMPAAALGGWLGRRRAGGAKGEEAAAGG